MLSARDRDMDSDRPDQHSQASLERAFPSSFFVRIPKSDLHVHLDGSIRITTLIDLAQKQGVSLPSYNPAELERTVFPATYSSLTDYLCGFSYITAVLRSRDALERVAYEVAMDAYDVGVRYLELRFAPQLHAIPGNFTIEEVIGAVYRGLERAVREADELDKLAKYIKNHGWEECAEHILDGQQREKLKLLSSRDTHPYHPDAPPHFYGIIVCAMRFFLPTFSPYYEAFWEVHKGEDPHRVFGLASVALVTSVNNLRRNYKFSVHGDCTQHNDIFPVVAIDIAGAESGYPASDHKVAFDLAHQSFLNKTVHAGEAYGPESIFEAITDLHAERIGHGCHLFRWDLIGEGEGRWGKGKRSKDKEEMNDDQKREYVENLTRYLASMRICVEVCLSSNLQTMPELDGNLLNHPARNMIDEGLAVTFCTDNTLVSHTDMAKELALAVHAFDLKPEKLRDIVFNGFKRSFMAKRYPTKRHYNHEIISFYKMIEEEYGVRDLGSDDRNEMTS